MWAQQNLPGASRHVTTQIESLELRTLLSVTPSFVEVPISAAAIAADPALANYRSFDLRVHMSAGDRWNTAGFEAVLSQGEFYRFDSLGTTSPAVWTISPQAEFSTFACVDNFGIPNSGLLPYVGVVGTPIYTATRFNVVWATLGGTPAGANDFTIARLTVPADAVGSIYGEARSIQEPGIERRFVASLPVGAQPLGLARGVVTDDLNRNQPNITVFDDVDNDGTLDADETSTTTNSAGVFQLIQSAGSHRYRAVAPAGFAVIAPTSGEHAVVTTSGAWLTNLDFTLRRIGDASISGTVRTKLLIGANPYDPDSGTTVFVDLNRNGEFNTNEPFAVTGQDGTYTIGALNSGSYEVRQRLSSNYAAVDGVVSQSVNLAAGQQLQSIDFYNVSILNGAIRGRVTLGTTALRNWRVYFDTNNNGVYDAGERETRTDEHGVFERLHAPGTYNLRLELNSGFVFQSPGNGLRSVTIVGGQLTDGINFSVAVAPQLGLISGTITQPAHHVAAGGSTALPNFTVYIDGDNDGQLDAGERRSITNAGGEYIFGDLSPGSYVMRVAKKIGWRYMSTSTDRHTVTLTAGQNASGKNFLYTQRIMIAGVVFDDKNGNGTKDAGENGINGRRVWVDLNNNALIDAGEPGGYIGLRGMFGFEDLVAGTYTLRAEAITGWTNVGSGASTITLLAGKVKVNVPFGQQKIVAPRAATLSPPRNIGFLAPENDLTSVWSRL